MPFSGKRILAFETRRAAETAELIRRNGGDPFVAPSMREVPIEQNEDAFAFAGRLFQGDFDMVIFLTGVGARYLARVLESRHPANALADALRRITVVARGPKPAAVLREWNVPVAINVPEPNTWREIADALKDRPERRIAVQLYGRPHPELLDALRAKGAEVTPVPVYQYALPNDTGPLREAAVRLLRREFDAVLFTTSQQVVHLFEIAGDDPSLREALNATLVASIGPTTSEMLREHGIEPALEPSHPKLGFLIKETAERFS